MTGRTPPAPQEWAREWIQDSLRAGPLTEAQWQEVEQGARTRYRLACLNAPAFVLRAASPLGLELTVAAATLLAERGPDHPWAAIVTELEATSGRIDASVLAGVRAALTGQDWSRVTDAGSFMAPVDTQISTRVDDLAVEAVFDLLPDEKWNAGPRTVYETVRTNSQSRDLDIYFLFRRIGLHAPTEPDGLTGGYQWGNERLAGIAVLTYVLEFTDLDMPDDLRERCQALLTQRFAGPALAFGGFLCASDTPTVIERDRDGLLHGEEGPAVQWSDGWSVNFWHGMPVARDFHSWDAATVVGQKNTGMRRMAIERLGWEHLIDRLTLVAQVPDPGNAPHMIRLYDLPDALQVYPEPVRLVVVDNASLDKGGHRRTFGLVVPAEVTDPLQAAADLFGITVEEYRDTERAT